MIVVDDGSTDATPDILGKAAALPGGATIKIITQRNAGPGPARNAGVAHSTTPWVVFHDSDDIWFPWTIEVLRAVLQSPAAEAAEVVFLQAQRFTDTEELSQVSVKPTRFVHFPSMLDFRLRARLQTTGAGSSAFRRDSFLKLGGFTDLVFAGEDTDLFFRAGLLPTAAVVAPVLMGYRKGLQDSLSDMSKTNQLFVLKRNRQGVYPGPSKKRTAALALYVCTFVRRHFSQGKPSQAYRLYFAGLATLMSAGHWGDAIRLPLYPLLRKLQRHPKRRETRRLEVATPD